MQNLFNPAENTWSNLCDSLSSLSSIQLIPESLVVMTSCWEAANPPKCQPVPLPEMIGACRQLICMLMDSEMYCNLHCGQAERLVKSIFKSQDWDH